MKRGMKFTLILMAILLVFACKSAPESQDSTDSGKRTKEEAEAKHAELIRKQEELRRRYGGNQQEQNAPEKETQGEATNE